MSAAEKRELRNLLSKKPLPRPLTWYRAVAEGYSRYSEDPKPPICTTEVHYIRLAFRDPPTSAPFGIYIWLPGPRSIHILVTCVYNCLDIYMRCDPYQDSASEQ